MSHERLEDAIAKANEAAAKLLRCAESISNPTYSVCMQGVKGDLEILSVRHFQGQIVITVKNPDLGMTVEQDRLSQDRVRLTIDPKLLENITDV